MSSKVFIFILLSFLSVGLNAQQAIVELETDDTLPIAPTRYDDAIEPPKNNFSSINKNDMWEKFERGDLDEKAFVKLQEQYQALASSSKDPYVKRKIASEQKEKIKENARKAKLELAQKKAEEKKKAKEKKKQDALAADMEIEAKLVVEKKEAVAQTKAASNRKPAAKKLPKKQKK